MEQDPKLAAELMAGLDRSAGGLSGEPVNPSYRLVIGLTVTRDLLAVHTSLADSGEDARQRALLVCRLVQDYLRNELEVSARLKRISVFGASRTLLSYADAPDTSCRPA